MRAELLQFLLDHQNPDGSWGYFPAKSGAIEPTAYALMALAQEAEAKAAFAKGLAFLLARQGPRGGWPVSALDSEESSWVSALAGLSLITCRAPEPPIRAAVGFVVSSFGKNPRPWILRVADWMRSWDASYVEENLGGWKWNPETANWVEPTAYALLFLKISLKVQPPTNRNSLPTMPERRIREIIREAESLLFQRMCREGGWNYGNARILGEELRPYVLTTALALMALQDQTDRPECRKSLAYLEEAIKGEGSALSLAMGASCFGLLKLNNEPLLQRLAALYVETRFLRNVKTAALALLGLQAAQGRNPFRFGSEERRMTLEPVPFDPPALGPA